MQIILSYGKFMKEFGMVKKADRAKLIVFYHDGDTMTVQQHVDFMTMKAKPEFVVSPFPDTETGWMIAAGSLLQEYGECTFVTDITALLEQGSFTVGKKSIIFKNTLEEAVKSGTSERKTARKKKEDIKTGTEDKPKQETIITADKEENSTESANTKAKGRKQRTLKTEVSKADGTETDDIDKNILKEETSSEDGDEFEAEDIEFEEPQKVSEANEAYIKKALSLGISEDACEPLREVLLDANSADELQEFLHDKVHDAKDVADKASKEFETLKDLARQAEAEIYL